jgi:pimeloyl-ACP methyl ester carboxylesterase
MHRIALVPGFLGFDHSGGLTYFADRFIAGLRAAVEARVDASVPVTPVSVPAIGSLKERQEALLGALRQLDDCDRHSWHLVGHSTGGLDSALLLREHKLAYGDEGSCFSKDALSAPKIESVTTIAAPHYGTCITRAPVVEVTKPGASLGEKAEGVFGLPELVFDALQRDKKKARFSFGTGAIGSSSAEFFSHLLFGNKLLRDLDPNVAAKLTTTQNVKLTKVPVLSIATLAPDPQQEKTSDHLFALLWKLTQLKAQDAAPPPLQLLADGPSVRIASDLAALPASTAIGPRESDGVVNTNRQVAGTFAGLVYADHCDVFGRYRRTDPFDNGVLDPGLLTSGANFGDDQFFKLIELVAAGIVRAIA